MKILAKNIKDKEIIKYILDSLKPADKYISTLNENSVDYELMCEKVTEHILEIEEALIGSEKFNNTNVINADIRMFEYWRYIGEKITWGKLIKTLKQYSSNSLLISLD